MNTAQWLSGLRRWLGRLFGGALAIGFFAGGFFWLQGAHNLAMPHMMQVTDTPPIAPTATAATGTQIADGILDTDEVDIASKLPGRLRSVFVREGDTVCAGQLVAILEADELNAKQQQATAGKHASEVQVTQGEIATRLEQRKDIDQVAQADAGVKAAKATLGMAQAKLTVLEHGARPQEIAQAEAGIQAAQATLGMAKARLSALRAGARPQEIAQAEQAVAAAQAAYDTAKKTDTRVKNLAEEGVVAQQKADETEMAYRSAEAALIAAKSKLDLVREGVRPQEIDAGVEQVNQAQAALEAARQILSIAREGPRKEEKEAARQQVQQAAMGVQAAEQTLQLAKDGHLMAQIRQKDVDAARDKVTVSQGQMDEVNAYQRQTRIYSPLSGRVTQRMSKAGEIIAPGYAIASVARTDRYWVDVFIDESKFSGHRVGDNVQVQIPALNVTLPAHIARLLPAADFATKRATNEKGTFDSRSVQLRITLDHTVTDLATGMTAHVEFGATESSR